MTKEEIKAAILAKIHGQGTAVDAGGALASILDAIIDLIPAAYSLPVASADELGGIKVGSNLSIDADGKLSGAAPYSLPTASAEVLGGVKVGSGLSIADGVLSASGGGNKPIILELTPYQPGDVTILEELYSKIKIDGENITSFSQLTDLADKFIIVHADSDTSLYVVYLNVASNIFHLVAGGIYGVDVGIEICASIDTYNLSDSFIFLHEL